MEQIIVCFFHILFFLGGIDTETSYPYIAEDEKCHYNPRNKGATDKGFVDIESGNEDHLKAAVATVGPVSVAIDASHESFQLYADGKLFIVLGVPSKMDSPFMVLWFKIAKNI